MWAFICKIGWMIYWGYLGVGWDGMGWDMTRMYHAILVMVWN